MAATDRFNTSEELAPTYEQIATDIIFSVQTDRERVYQICKALRDAHKEGLEDSETEEGRAEMVAQELRKMSLGQLIPILSQMAAEKLIGEGRANLDISAQLVCKETIYQLSTSIGLKALK